MVKNSFLPGLTPKIQFLTLISYVSFLAQRKTVYNRLVLAFLLVPSQFDQLDLLDLDLLRQNQHPRLYQQEFSRVKNA